MTEVILPGLNCGLCGFHTCSELLARSKDMPEMIKRCVHIHEKDVKADNLSIAMCNVSQVPSKIELTWKDSLGREFDFYLDKFPEEPGPREVILPHNPMLTREMDIHPGEIIIGRPLGMSCGCPITHCGEVMDVDKRTGVIVWCVTGPLNPRQKGFKDLGYYIAEGYEGLIKETRCDIKIGMRYFFQPGLCMLQWRHSGLINYINRTPEGLQVRVEGLWIG